ncbi:MAG: cytidine deaminase [Bacteroidales bacterium]|nr:cytidine deaminase [Bacteroidales bacterium]
MIQKNIVVNFQEYKSIDDLDNLDKELVEKAIVAGSNAYSPYSNFHVGAAAKLGNGNIICGNNQENAAYPSGLCAERTALFYANANFPDQKIESLVILGEKNGEALKDIVPPCGACRQVIWESQNRQKSPIRIILASKNKVMIFDDINQLLPFSFDDSLLK